MSTQFAESLETGAAPASPVQEEAAGGAMEAADSVEKAGGANRLERIRELAYASYEARGCIDGYALDDWLRAEAIVMQETADTAQPAVAA